jgi:hypothetical protein
MTKTLPSKHACLELVFRVGLVNLHDLPKPSIPSPKPACPIEAHKMISRKHIKLYLFLLTPKRQRSYFSKNTSNFPFLAQKAQTKKYIKKIVL